MAEAADEANLGGGFPHQSPDTLSDTGKNVSPIESFPQTDQFVTPIKKEVRHRSKAHLRFVAAHPCLICKRIPCDPHHLKFAQPKALGRKVSDEFAVPLCRDHHIELHRHGNERSWWANAQIDPLATAKELWHHRRAPLAIPLGESPSMGHLAGAADPSG